MRRVVPMILGALLLALPLLADESEFRRERKGDPAKDAPKNSLEGKAPPPLEVTGWLNSKPLTWADLRGKVVVIDFWGTW